MIVAFELLFQIHEVAVHAIEAAGEKAAKVQADGGIRFEESNGILHHAELTGLKRANLCGMGNIEKGREISEDGPRFVRARHGNPPLGDLHDSFDKKVDQAGGGAFGDDGFAAIKMAEGLMLEEVEQRIHNAWGEVETPTDRSSFNAREECDRRRMRPGQEKSVPTPGGNAFPESLP